MNPARAVTVIPATIIPFSANQSRGTVSKRRVAAYARVSTDSDEQLTSYEAQVDYYTRHIQSNAEWDFVEVYTDEGISATSTKNRDGFNRMITDALSGKIDMIITKSVSRFARNTVDTLTNVRKLKEMGVEVYFEKENIYTMDSKGELLITIMSSLAQEESRSISENVTWGQRKRFADGKVTIPYKRFLGYEKGADGLPSIVEAEAETVKLIYRMFLEGKTPSYIAKHLTDTGIPTPAGKQNWGSSTIISILTNEKYKGDARLQKTFTVDFLTKKKKVNEGEIPQYYVENSHPPIISAEAFDLVKYELSKRKPATGYKTCGSVFSGKIICGECGSFYGSKLWHSTDKYRRTIWQCNHKYNNSEKCKTPHLYEDTLKQAFVDAFNGLIENRDEILCTCEAFILKVIGNTEFETESIRVQAECDAAYELLRQCVDENARSLLDQDEYRLKYTSLVERWETAKIRLTEIYDKKMEQAAKRENINFFIQTLKLQDSIITEFDEDLCTAMMDHITVFSEHEILITFRNGLELVWEK